MSSARTLSIGLGAIAGFGLMIAAGPARADWHDHGWHHGWHHGGWGRHWGPPGVVVAPRAYYYPPPVVYAPPPVYYAPPPVYYAPPRPYYAPGVSLGVTIR